MFGLSMRFILSAMGMVLFLFAVLYGAHIITGEPRNNSTSDPDQGDALSHRRSSERIRAVKPSRRKSMASQPNKANEEVILNVAAKAKVEVAEQQRLQHDKRKEFFTSLEEIEDEQERSNLHAEWMAEQRETMKAKRQAGDTESAMSSQRLASMEGKLRSLRQYGLVPQLKPEVEKVHALMTQYAQQHESLAPDSKNTLWNQIEQGHQNLRRQHQQLINPERSR